MSATALNASMNVLQGVLKYKKDKQTHANDLAQQAVNNRTAKEQGSLAIQSTLQSASIERRSLGLEFLKQQKVAMARAGSAAVNAAWQGIEGATSNDLLQSVLQEAAFNEVERDEGLRSLHKATITRTADIIARTAHGQDFRNFSKPDVLAGILGIGQNVLVDLRKSGKIT